MRYRPSKIPLYCFEANYKMIIVLWNYLSFQNIKKKIHRAFRLKVNTLYWILLKFKIMNLLFRTFLIAQWLSIQGTHWMNTTRIASLKEHLWILCISTTTKIINQSPMKAYSQLKPSRWAVKNNRILSPLSHIRRLTLIRSSNWSKLCQQNHKKKLQEELLKRLQRRKWRRVFNPRMFIRV